MAEMTKNIHSGPAFPVCFQGELHKDGVDPFGAPLPAGTANQYVGATLLDYFPAGVGVNDLAGIRNQADREALAGRPQPAGYPNGLDSIQFNLEVEAALRFMYARAMLEARNG